MRVVNHLELALESSGSGAGTVDAPSALNLTEEQLLSNIKSI